MENASKALLIAAAVLIVILLIAFGVKIVDSAKKPIDGMEETVKVTDKATFNNKFASYIGLNKSTAQAKALVNLVVANNATNPERKIEIKFSYQPTLGYITDPQKMINAAGKIKGSAKIMVTKYSEDGLIKRIKLDHNLIGE